MGERKSQSKYIPPDDSIRQKRKSKVNSLGQRKVHMMLPMGLTCLKCNNRMSMGTKINSRKEKITGETYLGIEKFRFYFKCSICSAEMTIKTDPETAGYACELGCSRNWEPWKKHREQELEAEKKKAESDSIEKSLEMTIEKNRRDMEMLEQLRKIKKQRDEINLLKVSDPIPEKEPKEAIPKIKIPIPKVKSRFVPIEKAGIVDYSNSESSDSP